MKKHIMIIVWCFTAFVYAQNQGKIWYFGNNAGLDFNTSPPTPLTSGTSVFSC